MRESIYCHDGCLCTMVAKKNRNGTWGIYGPSVVYGMGDAEYEKKLFDFEFEDLLLMNSFRGIAYVCIKKAEKWGLIEIKDNKTVECEWKLISDFSFDSTEEMLIHFNVDISAFRLVKLNCNI